MNDRVPVTGGAGYERAVRAEVLRGNVPESWRRFAPVKVRLAMPKGKGEVSDEAPPEP